MLMPYQVIRAVVFSLVLVSVLSCKRKQEFIYKQEVRATDTIPQYVIPSPTIEIINRISRQLNISHEYKSLTQKFYSDREFRCAWFNEFGLTEQAGKVVNLISSYVEAGILDSTMYYVGFHDLYSQVSSPDFNPEVSDSLVLYSDIFFTIQFLRLSEEAWGGVDEEQIRRLNWYLPVRKFSLTDFLAEMLDTTSFFQPGNEPVYRQYLLLKEKLNWFAGIRNSGGFVSVPYPGNKGGIDENLKEVIASRLKQSGIWGDSLDVLSGEDSPFWSLVKEIRRSFGLTDSSVIDSALITELNVPVEVRIRQMLVNLERWKWIPPDPGTNYIVVNIPDYRLNVFEEGRVIKSMKVIVGKEATRTVIFSGDLSYIVFAPYWNIPRNILLNETLPAIRKDPSYLSRNNLEVLTMGENPRKVNPASIDWHRYSGNEFPYQIRELPGRNNALGRVKFLFPNDFSIYLHDTPAKELFKMEQRTFSHGCIRIAEPEWLADYLLSNEIGWNSERINESLELTSEKWVTLSKPIPVYITYFTSWVDDSGAVHFRNDVYGHDAKLEAELFSRADL
jgi:L,D-transpeptidase YcbB